MRIDELGNELDEGILLIDGSGVITAATAAARSALELPDDTVGRAAHDAVADYRLVKLIDETDANHRVDDRELSDAFGARHLRVTVIKAPDNSTAVIVRDETRMHQLERVRQDFVANVSHELRTPVAAIALIAETLLGGALEDPGAAREFVSRISLEVGHLTTMVVELLDLSRLEAGAAVLDIRRASLGDVLASLSRMEPLVASRDQQLVLDVADNLPMLNIDAGRIDQVFRNLVHNAMKYSPDGATIRVVARRAGHASVTVDVIDQGVGIATADLPRVFERFWKADRSRQRDGEGTGLGLAIARHIVDGHGGTIDVTSDPRDGTRFRVTLPVPTA